MVEITERTKEAYNQLSANDTYSRWQDMRHETREHKMSCTCGKCSNRRKLGARLILPYAGTPSQIRLRPEYCI